MLRLKAMGSGGLDVQCLPKVIRPRALEFTALPGTLLAMLSLIRAVLVSILALFRTRRNLLLENLAMRHQLAELNRERQAVPPAIASSGSCSRAGGAVGRTRS
jgi:hypothetical protein